MCLISSLVIVIAFLLVINNQFKFFYFSKNKLRILEYHSISINGFVDQITIKKEMLIEQFEYLKKNNYQTLWLSDIDAIRANKQLFSPKSIVLTFDDGFLDNYTELYPLLKEYDFKAVLFVVLGKIGQKIDWDGKFINDNDNMLLMDKTQLDAIESHIELGYHTFKHDNYALISLEKIEEDLQLCQQVISNENLKVFPALAYTYGGYYRKKSGQQKAFFELLQKYGIRYGLRIGNRINVFPFKNNYEIQRIDIRGGDSFEVFKIKVRFGRKKLF
jgi:peptidoglycan/xylan/chitin deacetylase (PgdA/CDA1 family)